MANLQRRLHRIGLFHRGVDGAYGDIVRRAVAEFQAYLGIGTDRRGVYGPETRRKLEALTFGSRP
ncbi:peptidoglycan-binding protein [Streptomyces sp. RPA4-5]|uniref:peptidoglycan-binding domain-containing protein n=1 Tax=Streptomyces sp. RPA4-5 TaxID=2721245 RepID=UPI00143E5103|nr:peptidoglycan-binding domain-containing protein [Streptomyces sp. RPA4-5]QIY53508.1 peptidoglycan-binding protein [Streptomyces sp. RPA4-5]